MTNTQNAVSVFNFENQQVDVLNIEGNPHFIGRQVATILGYKYPKDAIRDNVDEEDKQVLTKKDFEQMASIQEGEQTPLSYINRLFGESAMGGVQRLTIINESGLYSLILKSQLPSAKKFKRWVTSEVLPSIRKTGKYEAPPKINSDNSFFIAGLHGYIDNNGNALYNAKDVATNLKFLEDKPNRKTSTFIRWERLHEYLERVGAWVPKDKYYSANDFLPEDSFYRLLIHRRSKNSKNLLKAFNNQILPELEKLPNYQPCQIVLNNEAGTNNKTEQAKKVPKLTDIIREIRDTAEDLIDTFEVTRTAALEASINMMQERTNIDLEPLLNLLPHPEDVEDNDDDI